MLAVPSPRAFADPAPSRQEISEHFLPKKWLGDFDAMVARHEIRFLLVYSRTYYFFDKGHPQGLTYEAVREFEKYVNRKLDKEKAQYVKIVLIPVRRDELIAKLVEGYGDIAAANLTITPQRSEKVDFSDPVAAGVKEVVVTRVDEKSMPSFDELEGREIYVRKSSSYYGSLLAVNNLFKKTGRKEMKLVMADEFLEDEDLMEMVNAGVISTIIVDSHKAEFWAKILDNIQVHPDAYVRSDSEIAWAFRKNSPGLKQVVNEFVKKNRQGTLVGNVLINRYLRETKYVKNSTSAEELAKFQGMVRLFQKYADQYNFDYLMLGAQAYQESGLDQKKKSPAGAVGVMQILPATAKDSNINIPDIHLLENNIHAGTKYLRFLADRYFADDSLDPLNRMLFSFAAYNAGPARVRQIRKKTAEMGLNPDIWFRNAELAAGKIVGRETVQYVGNIYKYYIAYSMVAKRLQEKQQLNATPQGSPEQQKS
jgi:membrane-bound lytic murein transglycosylase MltF